MFYMGLSTPMSPPKPQYLYEYVKGTSAKSFAQDLQYRGIIPSGFAWLWYARLTGVSRKLHAGEYLITASMTPKDLLAKMVKGDVYLHTLRIPEGGTLSAVLSDIKQDPSIQQTLTYQPTWFAVIMPDQRSGEGLLMPETYLFPKHETDVAILKRANKAMMRYAQQAFSERDLSVPYATVYEALIVASILEKEASIPEERRKIARVILNRLAKHMPLQMDPTVIYGMGSTYEGKLYKTDLTTPTPYNTYLNPGLPPTPICMPSKDAIQAALHPAEGDFLYFVSQGDGSHYFSSTLKEHNQAVNHFIRQRQPKDAGP